MSSEDANTDDGRLSFQEMIDLVDLPSGGESTNTSVKRYMGTRAAWLPGSDISINADSIQEGKSVPALHKAAFGGHVYAQATLAICRTLVQAQEKKGVKGSAPPGLHVRGHFSPMSGTLI